MTPEREPTPEPQPRNTVCRWCHGTGTVDRTLAYVPGTAPFAGPSHTVIRPARCKHCRGAGEYDSAFDPTLDQEPRGPGPV